jgi:hypothetical protein
MNHESPIPPDDQLEDAKTEGKRSWLRDAGWFVLQLGLLWMGSRWMVLSLGGFYYSHILAIYQRPVVVSGFEFVFSHIFEFAFFPALVAGTLISSFRQRSAQFVWILPTLVLAYKLITFHGDASVFRHTSGDLGTAIHYYFGRNFSIGTWRNYRELFELAASNPDMKRGLNQVSFAAPFFATVGYSVAAALFLHTEIRSKLLDAFRQWYTAEIPEAEA